VSCREEGDTTYKMVVDRRNNTQRGTVTSPITDLFPKTVARYVRLTVVGADTSSYDGTWASISEFRVFGTEGPSTYIPDAVSGKPAFFVGNYPNPFREATNMFFHIPEAGEVIITIYNTSGEKITTVTHARYDAGNHTVRWHAHNLPEGIYFYHVCFHQQTASGKMLINR
jgi:hypothetical protein